MTAFGLYPTFTDREGYKKWRNEWKLVYKRLSSDILRSKNRVKELNRAFDVWNTLFAEKFGGPAFVCAGDNFKGMPEEYVALHKGQMELLQQRAIAHKMMTLLDEAKMRRNRILEMYETISKQPFPLKIEAKIADFSFNRGHNEFPDIIPRWMIKLKGKTFYVRHFDALVPFSTREIPEGKTKGMLRFRNCLVEIDEDGNGRITPLVGEHE